MKKKENIDFTKATLSGISLIMLVVTIIIMLILATVIVVTISSNNPVSEANKARYESDVDNMQALFTNMVSNVMIKNRGTVKIIAGGINEENGEVNYTVRNAKTKKNIEGKIIFGEGTDTEENFYIGMELPIYGAGDTNWYVDSDGKLLLEVAGMAYGNGKLTAAIKVANAPSVYYGEKVLNYTTGNENIDKEVEWQIFHSDVKNVYLIATDYVANVNLPKVIVNGKEYAVNTNGDYKAYFTNIVNSKAYVGSEDITDKRLQSLNGKYHEYLTKNEIVSKKNNMQVVAYMLDTNIWKTFAGEYAEYAIGGPTIEMLFNSYNKKYEKSRVDYRVQVAENGLGYEISKDGGGNWDRFYKEILNAKDTQYVISSDVIGMWLASPSAINESDLKGVYGSGNVGNYHYSNNTIGFRPIVCLNSDVTLKQVEGGYEIVE